MGLNKKKYDEVDTTLLTHGMQITVIRKNKEGFPVVDITENVKNVLGYTREMLVNTGKSFTAIVSSNDVLLFEKKLLRLKAKVEDEISAGKELREINVSTVFEYEMVGIDGDIVCISDFINAYCDETGKNIFFKSFLIDVTKYKEREETLKKRADEAELQNKHKSQFIANMSHDIRTPMNGMLGFLEVLGNTKLTAEQAEYVEEARDSCGVLLHLVNDILDISKIESFKLEIESLDFNLKDAVKSVKSSHRTAVENKGIALNVEFKEPLPDFAVGDESRLKQILNNLLSNAIKFTSEGEISLSVEKDAGDGDNVVKFTVSDSGIGMSDDEIERLYDPYAQASASTARIYGGTGLGLSITKRLVELMEGEIKVKSKKGAGTTFTVRIPFGKSDGIVFEDEYYEGVEIDPDLRVLLAEDNVTNQRLIRAMLQDKKIACDIAENGSEAFEMAKKNRYDIILMDCQMPVMDGYESTILIRRFEGKDRYTPIVAMTANAMKGDRIKAASSGMNDYITKPIDFKEFYAILYKYSNKKNKNRISEEKSNSNGGREKSSNTSEDGESLIGSLAVKLSEATGIDISDTVMLLNSFIKYLPGIVMSIEDALEKERLDEVASLAHQLKGSSGNYSVLEVSTLAEKLEKTARENDLRGCQNVIDNINKFIARF